MTSSAATGAPQEGPASNQADQESPADGQQQSDGGTDQASGTQSGQQFDPSTITDPTLRGIVEAQIKDAAEARREAARYRTDLRAAEGKITEHQRANETAEQAIERERQEQSQETERLRTENRDLKTGQAVAAALADAKPINPGTVTDLVKARLQYDKDGQPSNLVAVIDALKQSDPHMFRHTDAGAGAGAGNGTGQAPPTGGVNDFIRGGRSTVAR